MSTNRPTFGDLESCCGSKTICSRIKARYFDFNMPRNFHNARHDRIVEVNQAKLTIYNGSFEDDLQQKKDKKSA